MRLPARSSVGSAREWRDLCEQLAPTAERARVCIVHTRSATGYVDANFDWAKGARRLVIDREPDVRDFAELDRLSVAPQLVIGIGGGKALDAAKVVAHWGVAYRSTDDLRRVLATGTQITDPRAAKLALAPSLASSGSEASRAAVVAMEGRKTGLRGEAVMADQVVHDRRLWVSVTTAIALHYAFDIFAHLMETTVSLRRTPVSLDHAREGFARLERWLFELDASLAHYHEAMEASFEAGVCLATSSTCLPHRIQYVIGPATDTSHVEGIWYLSCGWFALVEKVCPERMADVAQLLRTGRAGQRSLREVFEMLHAKAAGLVRRERFSPLPQLSGRLAAEVGGDLAADPTYAGRPTVEQLIVQQTHD